MNAEEERPCPISSASWYEIWSLQISIRRIFSYFSEDAIRAHALKSTFYVEEAEVYLAKIEDSIRRYREGRPQAFDEEK